MMGFIHEGSGAEASGWVDKCSMAWHSIAWHGILSVRANGSGPKLRPGQAVAGQSKTRQDKGVQ